MLRIGVLQFTIEIPHAASLKDKRRVVKSMRDRIRRNFNVSIAETEDLNEWTVATLGAVMAGTDVAYVNGALDKLINALENERDAILIDNQIEIISPA